MSKFRAAVMTDAGASLMAAAFAEGFQMEFVKMLIGSGKYEENEKTVKALKKRTDLKNKRQEVGFSSAASAKENVMQLKALVTNENLDEGYHMTEIAVIAKKAGEGESEVLYSIAIADEADYLPSKENPVEIVQEFYTKVSNAEKVSINLNMSTVALAEDVEKIINPSFEEANARENIKKNDNYFTILGKIKKFFTDLKTIAFTGSYNDLENKPNIPAAVAVKGNAEKNYRTGNVNLTPDNIGALPISGGTLTGQLNIHGMAGEQPLKVRGIVGSDGVGNDDVLYLQLGVNKELILGNEGKYSFSADGGQYTGNAASATKAKQDGNGNVIADTYLTKSSVVNNNTTTEAGYTLDARQANPNVSGSMAAQMKSNYEPKLQIVSAASTAAELGAGATRTDTIIITIPTGYSFTGFVICDYNNNSGRTLTTIQTVTVSGSNVTVLVLLYNASSGKSNTLARVKALMVKNI